MALDRQEILDRLAEAPASGARDLSGLDLSGADLSRMDLRGVDLSRADLSAADLRWAILEGADLRSTILRRADVRWAVMRGANLRQADLGRANLGWADVSGADLSGADMDGANLENVDLSASVMERPAYLGGGLRGGPGAPRPVRAGAAAVALPHPAGAPPFARPGWWPESMALPQVSPAVVAVGMLAALVLVQLWGWLYRRAYFVGGFELDLPGIVTLGQSENFWAGLADVVLLTFKTLLAAPLVLFAIALVLGLLAAPVALLWYFGERVLDDIVRPQLRPVVIGGLFVAYTVLFVLFIIPGFLQIWRWVAANGLPGDAGLRAVFSLFKIGGFFTRVGLVAVLALGAVPLYAAWRAFCHWLVRYELPLDWRLRYPALSSAVAGARDARLFSRNEPLEPEDRRRALGAFAAALLLLATVLTGAGRVQAYHDMCDGGDLPRLQLYYGEVPPNVQGGTLCERMVAETDAAYYVFFPSQTRERVPGDLASREPNLRAIEKSDDIQAKFVSGTSDWCPACGNPNGQEVFIVYPNQSQTQGAVTSVSGDLVLLDVPPDQIGTVRLSDTTQVTLDGGPATAADILPGVTLAAFGSPSPDDPMILDAREVNLLSAAPPVPGATALPPAVLDVDLGDPRNPVFSGSGWAPGAAVEVRLVRLAPGEQPSAATAGIPLLPGVTTGPDGTFSAPVVYREGMPTGPEYTTLAVDPATGQVAQGGWMAAPPPTPTPQPTRPPAAPTEEPTATPEGGEGTATAEAEQTATAGPEATNTALPTQAIPGGPGASGECNGDEFEYDNTRGFQKEIYVGFGDPEPQSHTFCPKGDIDLAFFRVKQGRWYRVTTGNLAQGVDTVMAVGDLDNSTPCFPAGCWNDDRGALTYESEIVFQAVYDDVALITVDNRGTLYGDEATYELAVVEFQPEPTATPSPQPSASPTPTRTATPTRLPERDPYEPNDSCRAATESPLLTPGMEIRATLTRTDEDWFATITLQPGNYLLVMQPPDDQDYDMELRLNDDIRTRRNCPFVGASYRDGDDYEEIPFTVLTGQPLSFIVRVFPRPGSGSGDPSAFYYLTLSYDGPPPPTPTPTPPPSPTPTVTLTPTALPPEPSATPPAIRPPLP